MKILLKVSDRCSKLILKKIFHIFILLTLSEGVIFWNKKYAVLKLVAFAEICFSQFDFLKWDVSKFFDGFHAIPTTNNRKLVHINSAKYNKVYFLKFFFLHKKKTESKHRSI